MTYMYMENQQTPYVVIFEDNQSEMSKMYV